MFSLSYVPVKFDLKFAESINISKCAPLPFVLRSVLGYNLRSMSCVSHGSLCSECMYNKTCAYSYIFETIISQDNQLLPGINRASHPFVFTEYSIQIPEGKSTSHKNGNQTTASFSITLFGNAIDFLPYIYAAFFRAGKNGLFREKIPYEIQNVSINDRSILIDENNLNMSFERLVWQFDVKNNDKKINTKQILVELKTPLRFKVDGRYTKEFTAQDFMNCLYRRMKTCCFLYGSFPDSKKYIPSENLKIVEKKLIWRDKIHYSSRQKKAMDLGGVTGNFTIQGNFSDFELVLFDFAEKFNAGKNTNFGLGILKYWMKDL